MNTRPNYFCGVLYTLLGAVAFLGTVQRFATHQAGASLWWVGGSALLLLAGVLIIRETGVQRELQGRLMEPLPHSAEVGANENGLTTASARAVLSRPSARCAIDLHAMADRTSEWFREAEVGGVLAEAGSTA